MKCKLCNKDEVLKESHIIPKFVFRWMKDTSGGGYLRNAENFNKRYQDGPKLYLFCNECEKRLNMGETYFSKNIFYPYLEKNKSIFQYNKKLFYFLISILWRVLLINTELLKNNQIQHKELFLKAEKEWRKYLLGELEVVEFSDIHIAFTDIIVSNNLPTVFYNRYITRATDGVLLYSLKSATVYSKFSKFMVFGKLLDSPNVIWTNTKVSNGTGVLDADQLIMDSSLDKFIIERSSEINNIFEKGTSQKQKENISDWGFKNKEKFVKSELFQVLNADYTSKISENVFLNNKVGRNDSCPCGSGKKYKYCHGK